MAVLPRDLESNGHRLSRNEIVAAVDEIARRRRDMPGRLMWAAYVEGRLDEPGEVADAIVLARLLPDDDPFLRPA